MVLVQQQISKHNRLLNPDWMEFYIQDKLTFAIHL